MIKGTIFALGACLIWGLIFIVPLFMEDFSSLEVALGRYFFYGMISSVILFKAILQKSCRYPFSIWLKAFYFSLLSSIGYYTCVVMALRYSTPAICALILGIAPITIAFYGNWKQKECNYSSLIFPSALILIGLVIINAPRLIESESPSTYILGLGCGFLALITWSWFAVSNSRFLKQNPDVHSSDWSTLLGVTTFFWAAILALIMALFFDDVIDTNKYFSLTPELKQFLIGCAILGLLCSWVGGFLWNKASFYLPVTLAGQLTIFETIFGLLFVCILDQCLPPYLECIGILFFLMAIVYGIRSFSKNQALKKG